MCVKWQRDPMRLLASAGTRQVGDDRLQWRPRRHRVLATRGSSSVSAALCADKLG